LNIKKTVKSWLVFLLIFIHLKLTFWLYYLLKYNTFIWLCQVNNCLILLLQLHQLQRLRLHLTYWRN
jgi:hypothetical protein